MRMVVKLDARDIVRQLEQQGKNVQQAVKGAVENCADDLIRISSEIAPHDKGILEKSHSKEVRAAGDQVTADISYAVKEQSSGGSFNYAMYMHEGSYHLGPGSRAKPGTSGMSGKAYTVGNKYLTRPLEGEAEAYRDYMAGKLEKELRG